MRDRSERTFEIRKPYTQPSFETGTKNTEPSMTKASFAEDLDVNKIIKRFAGNIEAAIKFEGIYGEFNSYDLRDAMQKVSDAQELFMEVPSDIRADFDNDAGKFIDFVTDQTNFDNLREAGLEYALAQQVQDNLPGVEVTETAGEAT